MPIAKGEPWGEPGPLPEDGVVVGSDAAARAVLEEARRRREPFPVLGLTGGDLCRTLGGGAGGPKRSEERIRSGGGVVFPLDLGEVMIEGKLLLFVAHLVARNRLWTRAFVAMNAQWLGSWNLGPRAHPNDGLLDTYDATLPPGQLLAVRARLHHGAHLPHPGIVERRKQSVPVDLGRRLPVRLDGTVVGSASSFVVRVAPDALVVVA